MLDEIDLDLLPGTITVVVGPSGAGKSTLLKAVSMVEPPDHGTIAVGEQTFCFPASAALRPPWPEVGVVFQSLFLWPHLTLRQNLLLPHQVRRTEPDGELLREVVEGLGMTTFLDRHPNEVSGGERQRAALARAVLLQPRYLLLDEVTSALDVEQVRAVSSLLGTQRARGTALLVVTHLLGFARRVADHAVIMDRGRIVEQGPAAILDAPRTSRARTFLSLVDAIA